MKKMEKQPMSGNTDLSASIKQSTADKLLNSVDFPFTVLNENYPSPRNLLRTETSTSDEVILEDSVVRYYLIEIDKSIRTRSKYPPESVSKYYSEAWRNLSETIECAKSYMDANQRGEINPKTEDPIKEFATEIFEGGIQGLSNINGIQFKAICSHLEITAQNRPNLALNGPKISVSNSHIRAQATGELWWYHPTIHIWPPSVSWSWDRLMSISVDLMVDFDGNIKVNVNGKIINANLYINNLRLDYPILKEIPLEVIANKVLENKQIPVFDAGSFVASIPVINSKFAIESIDIPDRIGSIDIDITIKQVSPKHMKPEKREIETKYQHEKN